jgi:hypothetical protein
MKKTRKTQPTGRLTFYPSIPQGQATQAFRKSVSKPVDGANDHLADFLAVTERVMELLPTFSIHDMRREGLAFEIPEPQFKRLFEAWSEKMISMCKLERVQGVYDYPVYVRI